MANNILPFANSPPTLSDFIVGENDEILCAIRALAEGKLNDVSVYIWGESGVGKSCLLKAACSYARRLNMLTYHVVKTPQEVDTVPPPLEGLLVVDDVGDLPRSAQITLFDWHNRAFEQGRQYLLSSGSVAPGDLPVMDELQTRLAGGLVFRLQPLDDADKQRALSTCAARRGFNLPPEIGNLLLSRLPRNMRSLESALADLDAFLLTHQKPLTVRAVNNWLMSRLSPLSLFDDG